MTTKRTLLAIATYLIPAILANPVNVDEVDNVPNEFEMDAVVHPDSGVTASAIAASCPSSISLNSGVSFLVCEGSLLTSSQVTAGGKFTLAGHELAPLSAGSLHEVASALNGVQGFDPNAAYRIGSWNGAFQGACLTVQNSQISIPSTCPDNSPLLLHSSSANQKSTLQALCQTFTTSDNSKFKYCSTPVTWAIANSLGKTLGAVTASNIDDVQKALKGFGVKYLQPVWIGSWNGDSYNGACITLIEETVSPAPSCSDMNGVLYSCKNVNYC
ncbi:hypothetical protein HDU76_001423 [Blyttiomyces sp. JEL0837]|nr:hypothetical protein HDU76_001423 [Blyttiomyces sp. JEL0837]